MYMYHHQLDRITMDPSASSVKNLQADPQCLQDDRELSSANSYPPEMDPAVGSLGMPDACAKCGHNPPI